jgi:hypothetical protein
LSDQPEGNIHSVRPSVKSQGRPYLPNRDVAGTNLRVRFQDEIRVCVARLFFNGMLCTVTPIHSVSLGLAKAASMIAVGFGNRRFASKSTFRVLARLILVSQPSKPVFQARQQFLSH